GRRRRFCYPGPQAMWAGSAQLTATPSLPPEEESLGIEKFSWGRLFAGPARDVKRGDQTVREPAFAEAKAWRAAIRDRGGCQKRVDLLNAGVDSRERSDNVSDQRSWNHTQKNYDRPKH